MRARAYIGTSGWNYDEWRDNFYRGIKRKDWLQHYAHRFTAVEINASFYRLQTKATYARWRASTPASFRFAIKGNRYLTHTRRLRKPAASIRLERGRASALGEKLAAVIWQLPARFSRNLQVLEQFAKALARWPEVRHAIEFRDASWFENEVADCLGAHGIGVCQSDAADWPQWDAVTADFVYVRLHGHARTYASAYPRPKLAAWARRIRRWLREGRDVHVYFDNTAAGHAPANALTLARMLDAAAVAQA